MLKDQRGLTLVEYIIGAALILAVVGASVWALTGAIAGRLDEFRSQL